MKKKLTQNPMEFFVIIERDQDGYYIATVPSLFGCYARSISIDMLLQKIKKSIFRCLKNQDNIFASLDFIGIYRMAV